MGKNIIDNKNKVITEEEIKDADLFEISDNITYNDQFLGVYKNISVRISEIDCQNSFHGIVISMNIIKKLNSTTIVSNTSIKKDNPLADSPLVTKSEKSFKVYSTNPKSAKHLFSRTAIEDFKKLQQRFSGKSISCIAKNNNLFIAISTYKELCSIANLNIPITNLKQYDVILEKFISIFEIIEELKLYENTGL